MVVEGCVGLVKRGPPPARPFDGAQGERSLTGERITLTLALSPQGRGDWMPRPSPRDGFPIGVGNDPPEADRLPWGDSLDSSYSRPALYLGIMVV